VVIADVSVDCERSVVKNSQSRHVRNRTSGPIRPETRDRRVLRTKASLRSALIDLAHEKPYDSIAVKEILDRANVGRSTFYTHFQDKHELLASGIREMLRSIQARPRCGSPVEQIIAFSLPILEYIGEHRHTDGPRMTPEGQIAMHARLRDLLTNLVYEEIENAVRHGQSPPTIPTQLVARHVASTFVLVLNWWVESRAPLTPLEIDARFRALVLPILTTL
jgi:AcrR family transcriptional regulator